MESQNIPPSEKVAPLPPPESRKLPWLTFFCVLSVVVGLGFAMWKSAQPKRFSVVKTTTTDVASAPQTKTTAAVAPVTETVRRAAPATQVAMADKGPSAPPTPPPFPASSAPPAPAQPKASNPLALETPASTPAPPAPMATVQSAPEAPKPPTTAPPGPAPQPAPSVALPTAPSPVPAAVSSAVATTPVPPAPSSPEPVNPGPLPDAESFARIRSAREVLQAIASAASLDERLKWIADGATHRDRVEKFFKNQSAGLVVTGMEANMGAYAELPSGDDVKLLLATTASCPSGAMVRLRTQGNKALLDWPLFEQTHQLEFDEFAANASATPRRFTVICARSRAYELPDAQKDKHLALRAQGSLSVHGEALLYYDKDSVPGKFLDSNIVWGRGYLVDVMIEHAVVAEKKVLIITDCAGAASPAK